MKEKVIEEEGAAEKEEIVEISEREPLEGWVEAEMSEIADAVEIAKTETIEGKSRT